MPHISFGISGLVPTRDWCLALMLQRHVQRTPDAPAILAPGRPPLTYRRLEAQVRGVVGTLRAAGLRGHDRVAVYVLNGPEMAAAFVAVATGAVCVPLNPAYPADTLDAYLARVDAKALVVDARIDTPVRRTAQARGLLVIDLEPLNHAEAGLFDLGAPTGATPAAYACAQPDDIALILRTSGTTAQPRIVPLTHANLFATTLCAQAALALTEHDRCLNALPLYHSHGLVANLMPGLVTGGSVICAPHFDPDAFFEWLDTLRPTWFSAVPAMHQSLLSRSAAHRAVLERHALRFIRSGSAPLPPQVLQELERVFETPVLETYGMTEGCSISCNPLPPHVRKAGSVGRAVSSDIAVMDERDTLLPAGVEGEIVVRGANLFAGYDQDDAMNRQVFARGWFRTGDQGYLDADGYLFITGRIKEIINRGGQKIAPREIDRALMAHPAVARAVAFGVPHPRLGEDVAAAVVLHRGAQATADEIRQFAALRLAPFQVPQRLLILEELPQSAIGKVQRIGLAEKLGLQVMDPGHTRGAEASAAPRPPLQDVLAGIWTYVLGIPHVGMHDNFFLLGGDSILASRMLARVYDALHVDIPIRDFFISPTISDLARQVESLQHGAFAQPSLPLLPVPRTGPLPLSYPQQRLWFLNQLGLSSFAYTLVHVLQLRGALNVAALAQSLRDCVARHEILRTTFIDIAGEPWQQVGLPPEGVLETIAVEVSDTADWEQVVRACALEEIGRPFDLRRGPLFRPKLLRLSASHHVLILTMHHIVADAWSHSVLWRDLGALYEAHASGRPPSLPDLPVQYADFAAWQLQVVAHAVREPQLSYWTHKLAGAPILRLPTDRPRPPRWTSRGARHPIRLSLASLRDLKVLSQQQGTTLFMTLLAAFAILLYRYTQQDDFIVGTLVTNRNRAALEGLIGFFINTLALRVNLEDNPRCAAFLERIREVTLDAYHYRELPFEKLLEVLRPPRDLSRNPLFQVLFVLQNSPQHPPQFGDIAAHPMEVDSATAKFDLTLDLTETPAGLHGWLEYSTDLFDAATVARMAGHFQTLVEGLVAHAGSAISELSLLRAAERQQLVYDWNQTRRDFPMHQCLHQLLEAQAARTPDAVAVVDGDQQLTYQALNARANQLARYLQAQNVGPETVVGLCIERSCELIIGIFGILKAGGAYLPLDPSYPVDRLAFMLDDAHVSVLLTQQRLVPALPRHDTHIACIDAAWQTVARYATHNPDVPVRWDNLAYVLYTSGSTGKPKGVLGLHRTVLNTLMWMWQTFPITDDVCCQKTSISFGDSLQELFGPLLRGARLVLIPDAVLKEAPQFVRALATYQVTRLILVPSLLRLLLDTVDDLEQRLPRLRLWIAGGESLPVGLCQRFRDAMPHSRLVNLYGMSETTDDATYADTRALDPSRGSVPIGRPIANTQLYVLDRSRQPVPIGVPGELYLGGVGLTRGYLDRPDLTANVFMPDPFSGSPGARLYKTGDLVRYLPHGALEYFGRLDHQVKVRGFRIELEEVETALEQHPAVRQAIVLDREDTPGERYLAAYVRAAQDPPLTVNALRAFLRAILLPHMVPTAFVFLDVMPQTPSGKVNRRALPVPPRLRPELSAAFVAPRNPTEDVIASIWSSVLDLECVGIHDNFFDLGGHSLLAVRVLSRLRDAFQATVSLQALFDTPTVASLASHIESQRREEAGASALPLAPMPRPRAIPATLAQEHIWLLARLLPQTPFFHISHAFCLSGPLCLEALEHSLNALIQRHESLRTAFVPQHGQLVQHIADALTLTLAVEDVSPKSENSRQDAVRRFIREEAERPFALQTAPLMRVRLLQLAEHEYVLLLTWHHLIMDGWSMGVFTRELAILYDTFAHGAPPSLPPLRVQYADYTLWYEKWRTTAGWERQLAYWRQQLHPPLPVLRLPADRPREPARGFHTAREAFAIPRELAEAMRRLSRQEGATLFMTLLTAFKILLHSYTGQDDLCVATHVANRGRREVEDLIGYLVNTVFLRTHLGGDPTWRELLQRVRATTLAAYEHQDLAMEELVQVLEQEHHVHRASLSQAMLVFHTAKQYELTLPGIMVQPWDAETSVYRQALQATTFDLILILQEHSEGLAGSCIYQTTLFNAETIQRLLSHYQRVLEQIEASPGQLLSAFVARQF